jgi:GH24 family phage-related lysozyme (muramidase)
MSFKLFSVALILCFVTAQWQCPNLPVRHKDDCGTQDYVAHHEGCKLCAYYDSKHIPTIGIGFNLADPSAKSYIEKIGADINKLLQHVIGSRDQCNCSVSTCLTMAQVTQLFQYKFVEAEKSASSVGSFCCPVHKALTDMAYNLRDFLKWTTLFGFLRHSMWDLASKDLTQCNTNYCGQVGQRCIDNAALFKEGCGCSGLQCSGGNCCAQGNTCCPIKFPCSPGQPPIVSSSGCCPVSGGICCDNNTCCQPEFPVCCPAIGLCCRAGSVCGVGYCSRDELRYNNSTVVARNHKF